MNTALLIVSILLVLQGTASIVIGATILMQNYQIEIKPPSKPLFKRDKPITETPEQIRERTILENLEAYDGTGKGQIKV